MPYCPNCKYEYVDGMKSCPDCDVELVGSPPEEAKPQEIALDPDEFVRCWQCDNRIAANTAVSLLGSQGIESWVLSGRSGGYTEVDLTTPSFVSPGRYPEYVMVPRSKMNEALGILQEMMPDGSESPGASGQPSDTVDHGLDIKQRYDEKPWYAR